jgi:[protein-PII] uridylyltransferase
MRISLEKIQAHANEKLTAAMRAGTREELVELFRSFLKIETERLKLRHRFGLSGSEIAGGRSYLVDLVLSRAAQWAVTQLGVPLDGNDGCAVIALGGYARRELAPHSDVDLLFLHTGRQSHIVKQFVEQVLHVLWDIGLMVGHSFRSVAEAVTMAREDLPSRNAIVEAQFITGTTTLFCRLMRDIEAAVFKNKRDTDAFLEAMKREREARYAKFGKAVCLQEPNLKESAGGLRDLHTVLWVGHARYGCGTLEELRAGGHISGTEHSAARRAYDFLLRVRNEAHFSTGRKTDLLTLDLQPSLAQNLGYERKRGLLASELFMRDYYRRAHELHQFCDNFLVRALAAENGKCRFPWRSKPVADSASFEARDGKLCFKGEPSELAEAPMRLMEIFSLAQREDLELSDQLRLLVRSHLTRVDRRVRAAPEISQAFIEMLGRRGRAGRALRMMHETGVLARLLPEFGRITFVVQHDYYHKYTIDEHLLQAVEALDRVVNDEDPKLTRFKPVLAELEDVSPLYLGVLLHDIGKGHGGGHVPRGVRITERMCQRLGLDPQSASPVVFLVEHHLLMSHLSQRRDIGEDRLVEEFATTVATLENLNMLLLLTYADTSAVGPGVWTDWKAALLWELYTRTRAHLLKGKPGGWNPNEMIFRKQLGLQDRLRTFPWDEIERHLDLLPEKYLRATEPDQLARHFQMVKRLESDSAVYDWRVVEDKHCTELTVCARDRAGLFARVAGTLTAHGVNILSADLHTREDGIVIDTFQLSEVNSHHPVRASRWHLIELDLKAALEDRYDVAAAVEKWRVARCRPSRRRRRIPSPPTVRFDPEASATSTVMEVKAEDEPGLAYKIASTLSALGLNISFAKIATDKSQALDVFYVSDSGGRKLTPGEMACVEQSLLEALSGETDSEVLKNQSCAIAGHKR